MKRCIELKGYYALYWMLAPEIELISENMSEKPRSNSFGGKEGEKLNQKLLLMSILFYKIAYQRVCKSLSKSANC